MSKLTSELTPNAIEAEGIFDEPIRIDSINMTELKFTKSTNSNVSNDVESIGDIKVNL
jgi:hypothetical protein